MKDARNAIRAGLICGPLAAALVLPQAAQAHGLVGRSDLPIPEWLFAWAAAVVLIVSFMALATLWRTPKFEGHDHFKPLPIWIDAAIVNPVTKFAAGLAGVFLLGVVIWAGLTGTESPQANFAPTFVYVIFWVGLVAVSLFFGDVFRAFNPWLAIGRAAGFVATRISGPLPRPFELPERWGRWPAVAPVLLFGWMELAFLEGQTPKNVAIASLVYTAYTLVAMAAFGTKQWIERGEGFSVYFNFFSRIAPLEVRDGRLGLRPPLEGLTTLKALPGTAAFVIMSIGIVTFDGASEGPTWGNISREIQDLMRSIGFSFSTSLEIANTIGILVGIGFIAAIYSIGIAGARKIDARDFTTVARAYAHTLIPISAAYVLAHYFSFLIFNGQAVAFQISDPLGDGSNYFGTANSTIDYGVVSATAIWYVQVGILVVGHVAGLVLAHDRALSMYNKLRDATRSQYWMLGVMVGFTTFGLWLLSQANG